MGKQNNSFIHLNPANLSILRQQVKNFTIHQSAEQKLYKINAAYLTLNSSTPIAVRAFCEGLMRCSGCAHYDLT